MTKKQYMAKVEIALMYGSVKMGDGSELRKLPRGWAVWERGNCVDTSDDSPMSLFYLYE